MTQVRHGSLQAAHRCLSSAHLKFIPHLGARVLKGSEHRGRSMSLRTLIVDDEPIARRVLREELESIEDIEIVGEADDGATALEKIVRASTGSCASGSADAGDGWTRCRTSPEAWDTHAGDRHRDCIRQVRIGGV